MAGICGQRWREVLRLGVFALAVLAAPLPSLAQSGPEQPEPEGPSPEEPSLGRSSLEGLSLGGSGREGLILGGSSLKGPAPEEPSPGGASSGAAVGIDVRVEGGRVSASLGAVPVVDVLAMVAQQTGATLSVRGELGKVRPQAFTRMPLAEALPRLAQPNGLILQFDETRGDRRLLAIHAVAPGSTGGSPGGTTRRVTGQASIMKLWNYEDGSQLPSAEQRTEQLNKLTKQRKGGSTVVQSLVYVLSGDPDPAVRRTALGLLAGLPGDEARRAVLQTVVDVDPDMRVEALRALSATGEKPVSVLAQIVKGDTDANVRLAAIGMLDSRDGDLARAVLEGARGDADPQVREAAQQALRR